MFPVLTVLLFMVTSFCASDDASDQNPDYCNLYGAVYITEIKSQADYQVYEGDTSAQLFVFEAEDKFFASEIGVWYFTDHAQEAKFTVYFTEDESYSNFTVYFTDFQSEAGCQ